MEISVTSRCLSAQGVTVMVQGQGQTAGQLQVIPPGMTVIPGAGQQLMQAVLPNGQVQRFLFTPSPASPSTPGIWFTPTISHVPIWIEPRCEHGYNELKQLV